MKETIKAYYYDIAAIIPNSLMPILITLVLSFLIGLERQEQSGRKPYNFGGVCTFPIIGLSGYLMALLAESQPLLISIGLLVIGGLMWVSYYKKLELTPKEGMTSEISAFFTFLLGALIFHRAIWEATTLAVIVLLLLGLKKWLEKLAKKIPGNEIFTFTRFLLIAVVILPIVPDRDFTHFNFNPFHIWLIIVAISTLSYTAYVIERLFGSGRSIIITAILGGLYSSTSTTVVLAKRSEEDKSNHLYTGAIIIASGFMYFRLVALISIFNFDLSKSIIIPFIVLGILFSAIGLALIIWNKGTHKSITHSDKRNPLELKAAFIFAALFSFMSILTVITLKYFGSIGIYTLSFFAGLTDIDPFVMSLTQTSSTAMPKTSMAAQAIIIASASNNVIKGIYAVIWGFGQVRTWVPAVLTGIAFLSLLACFFV